MRTAAFATLLIGALAIKVKEEGELWDGATVESIGEGLVEAFGEDSFAIAEHLFGGMDNVDTAVKAGLIQEVLNGDVDVTDFWLTDNLSMAHAGEDNMLDEAELLGLAAKLGATEDDGSAAAAMSEFDLDMNGALDLSEQDALWRKLGAGSGADYMDDGSWEDDWDCEDGECDWEDDWSWEDDWEMSPLDRIEEAAYNITDAVSELRWDEWDCEDGECDWEDDWSWDDEWDCEDGDCEWDGDWQNGWSWEDDEWTCEGGDCDWEDDWSWE